MAAASKLALVTGAGSGIGKATAHAFLADGYRVALAGRRGDALERTAAESTAADRALVVPTDVADPASVDALFARVRGDLGRLDVLFNNAGSGSRPATLDDTSVEDWRRVVIPASKITYLRVTYLDAATGETLPTPHAK